MSRKTKEKINAFANVTTDGMGEAQHRLTAKAEESGEAGPVVTKSHTAEAMTPKRGRPPGTEKRTAFTCRPLTETVKQMRMYAAEHGCTLSQIIDTLTELHLQDSDVADRLNSD